MNKEIPSILRFDLAQRAEHLLLVLSFGTLGLTGLIQLQVFQGTGVQLALIFLLGGIESVRIIHRIAATVLMLETIYHLFVLGYKYFVRRLSASMLPEAKDARDALQTFGYNLGFIKQSPLMKRYNFAEKAEYWAMIWGLLVMGVTGFVLWNPIATSKILPGQFVPAAKVAHGGEAILAVLAIIIWHFYNVHIKEWNWSMFNGRLSRRQMEEGHALELEEMDTGSPTAEISSTTLKNRQKIYFPVASGLAILFLIVAYLFVNYEDTAIRTVPMQENQVVVYVPQTPVPILPTSTQIPLTPTQSAPTESISEETPAAAGLSWSMDISKLFEQKCTGCHGKMGGVSFTTYVDAMKGGVSGPVIIPNDSEGSPLVVQQSAGGHPANFSKDELALIREWIGSGAVETAGLPDGESKPAEKTEQSQNWDTGIGGLFAEKCITCHGAAGGLSLETYSLALKGGNNGQVIIPGSATESPLVALMSKGVHPVIYTPEELKQVIDWIEAGALEK